MCLTSCSSGEEHEASFLPSTSSVVADDLEPVDMLASVPARDDDNEAVDPTFDLESSVRSDRDYQIINTIPLGQANLISSFASPPACTPDIPHQKSLWASLVLGRSRTRDTPLRFDHVRLTCLGRSTSGRSLCFCSRAQLF